MISLVVGDGMKLVNNSIQCVRQAVRFIKQSQDYKDLKYVF